MHTVAVSHLHLAAAYLHALAVLAAGREDVTQVDQPHVVRRSAGRARSAALIFGEEILEGVLAGAGSSSQITRARPPRA